MFVGPIDGKRSSIDENEYHGFAGGHYGLEQVKLSAGKVQTRARLVFTAGAGVTAQYDNGYVAVAGQFYGLVNLALLLRRERFAYQFALGPVGIYQVTPLGIDHLGTGGGFGLDAVEDGGHVNGQWAIVSEHVTLGVGIRAAHGNAFQSIALQGQEVAGILEQYERLAGCFERYGLISRGVDFVVGRLQVGLVGLVEEAYQEFHAQNVSHAVVDGLHRNGPLLNQVAQRLHIRLGGAEGASDVQTGPHALQHRLFHILGRMVFHVEVFHRVTVRHHVALKAELLAQAFHEPVVAALNGESVVVVVRTHHAQQSGFGNDASPGVDVHHFDLTRRHLRVAAREALAGTLIVAVGNEVLARGCHLIIGLQSFGHFHAEFGHQVGRLAIHFFVAAPSLVAPHVEDGGIDVGVAEQSAFATGNIADAPHQVAVPGMAQAELGGKVGGLVGFHASDALVGHVGRNAQAGLFYKEALHLVDGPGMA